MSPELREKITRLPGCPGVYIMHGSKSVLYVGKAKDLRKRWSAYLNGSDERPFVKHLERLLVDVEIITTETEAEALLLERELIRIRKPRFNVRLTDDKRFLCLRLDLRHPYPRLTLTRRLGKEKGVHYYGPFHSSSAVRTMLKTISRHFQLRTCTDEVLRNRTRPCLQYQVKRCPAPCVFDLSESYPAHVADVRHFLDGRNDTLLADLRARMETRSASLEFEQAARIRDQIRAIEQSLERQAIIGSPRQSEDHVGIYREGTEVHIFIRSVRGGVPRESHHFALTKMRPSTPALLGDFLARHYLEGIGQNDRPRHVLLGAPAEGTEALAEVLKEREGRAISISTPQRGEKRKRAAQANRDAEIAFGQARQESAVRSEAQEELKRRLRLAKLPQAVECLDISHLQGGSIVGSVVRFEEGKPHKKGYRHYRLRGMDGQDDFAALYQVLSRRVCRGIEDADLPDLFVIDGGKGQLAAAYSALVDHGLEHLDIVSLAKARQAPGPKSPDKDKERLFVRNQKDPIVLSQRSNALLLLTRMRDEAHRFAISYQRKLQKKRSLGTQLDEVEGVGPARRKKLLRELGSVKAVKEASAERLAEVVGPSLGEKIFRHFHPDEAPLREREQ